MSTVVIVKNPQGRLEGFGQSGAKTYGKFKAAVDALEIGETLQFDYKVPRSGPFHRRHFAMLDQVYQGQEQFDSDYDFRKWTEVGAGHVIFCPGPHGKMVALPRSISYSELEQDAFEDLHEKVKAFLRTRHATSFLWGHLDEAQQISMIEELIGEFS